MGVGVGTGVGGREGVSVGGGTLGVLVGIGVSVAGGAGVKVGLGVLVGVGTGVGALAINEVSGHPRHPSTLPKTNTMIITNRDLLIILCCFHSPLKQSGQCRAFQVLYLEFQLLWPEIPYLLALSLSSFLTIHR
jgi:hypothetical protein